MGFLNTIFKFVRPITQNLMGSSSLLSLLLGKKLEKIETIPTRKESPVLNSYLEAPLNTSADTKVKKAMAVAAAIAEKKGVASIKAASPMEMAAAVDDGMSRMKVAYQVGKGILNTTSAAEEIIDRAAARLTAFTDKVIDKGTPIVVDKVLKVAAKVCPPVLVVVPIIKMAVPFISNAAKKIVRKGVEIAATAVKKAVKTVVNGVKKVGKKLFNFLFG